MAARMGPRKRKLKVEYLLLRDGDQCTWCCRVMLNLPVRPELDCSLHITIEHLVPVSVGGSHELLNLALACFECNNARADSPVEFIPSWAVPSDHDQELEETHGGPS